jgi:hypothetical protein
VKLTGVLLAALLLCVAAAHAQIRGPLVVADRWPECTSLKSWADDIWRLDGVTSGSERQKAVSLFKWLRLFNRLNCEARGGVTHAFEGPFGKEINARDLHKHLFVYGWGFCDTHSVIAEGIWCEFKKDLSAADRVICMHESGGYHTMYRLNIDGKPGAFDARYGYYLIEKDTPDARILDWDGVGVDKNVWDNMHYKNRCKPFVEFPQHELERLFWLKPKPVFKTETAWREAGGEPEVVFLDPRYKLGTRYHDMKFNMPRGTTIERHWDNSMKKWFIPGAKGVSDQFLPEGRFYRVGASMVGGDGEKNDPNFPLMKPYMTRVPVGMGYPEYIEGDMSLGQAWGKVSWMPDLASGAVEDAKISGQGLVCAAEAPFVRPEGSGEGEWVLEFYMPYVMVEGYVTGELAGDSGDRLEVAFRSQVAKATNQDEPDQWLPWKTLAAKPGHFQARLDRGDAAVGESSFHGAYRWQLRIRLAEGAAPDALAGLNKLGLFGFFENGIMSIPQLFDGSNTVRFKVDDPAEVKGDIEVSYKWQTADGEQSHVKRIVPGEMLYNDNEAVYVIDAPGLIRCNSLTVSYE